MPRQRIGAARPWLVLFFNGLGVASFDQLLSDAEWLESLVQHAAHLPLNAAVLPANADTKASVLISQPDTQRAAPFRPAVPSSNRDTHGQVAAWVGLGLLPSLKSATKWNGAWTPTGGQLGQIRARQTLGKFLGQLQPLTRSFEGTFGQLLCSPVAALDPLLRTHAAPLDADALFIEYGQLQATRLQLVGLLLGRRIPLPQQTLELLQGELGRLRPTLPQQMLEQGEVQLAHLAHQLAELDALSAEAYEVLAPPEVSIGLHMRPGAPPAWRRLQPPPSRSPPPPATALLWTNSIPPHHPGAGCCAVVGPCSRCAEGAARGDGEASRGRCGPAAVWRLPRASRLRWGQRA